MPSSFGQKSGRIYGAKPWAERRKKKPQQVSLQHPGRNTGPASGMAPSRHGRLAANAPAGAVDLHMNSTQPGHSAPGTPQGLLAQWQQGHDEAKAANESRYQEILGNLGGLRDRNMGLLDQIGTQQAADLRDTYRKAETRGAQDLVSAGLAGTTAMPNMRTGVAREQQDAMNRLDAGLKRERIGYDTQFENAIAGFQERRTDAYPDLGTFAAAMSQLGDYYGGPRPSGGRLSSGSGSGGRKVYGGKATPRGPDHPRGPKRGGLKKKNWGKTNSKNRPPAASAGGGTKRDPVPGITGGMYDPDTMERVDRDVIYRSGGWSGYPGGGGRPKGEAQRYPGGRRGPAKKMQPPLTPTATPRPTKMQPPLIPTSSPRPTKGRIATSGNTAVDRGRSMQMAAWMKKKTGKYRPKATTR